MTTESPGFRRSFAPDPNAPAVARRELEGARGHVGDELIERCQLVTTELLANCVRHAGLDRGDEIVVEFSVSPDVVRVEVTDAGKAFDQAAVAEPGHAAAGGWGLWLVNKMADRWGVEFGRGTRVWSEFDV